MIRQGEVYWIDFGPVAGSTPAERHPCVVVQSDLFNKSRPSVVNVSQVVTVDKSELCERLGRLSAAKVDPIRRGLHLLFDRD